jgi:intracellular proteinase inhibitor BsuPI
VRPTLAVALLLALAGCATGEGGRQKSQQGRAALGLEARFSPDPLRSGEPATWLLVVTNRSSEAATITFSSGQNGNVVLEQGGREIYRWSSGKFFTQAVRPVSLDPGASETYRLEEERLGVEAGRYRLVASLNADPAPAPARRDVTVE